MRDPDDRHIPRIQLLALVWLSDWVERGQPHERRERLEEMQASIQISKALIETYWADLVIELGSADG